MDNVQTTKSDLKVALWIFRYFYYENGCLNSSLFGCIYLWSRTDSCCSYYKFSYFAISQAISVCLIIFLVHWTFTCLIIWLTNSRRHSLDWTSQDLRNGTRKVHFWNLCIYQITLFLSSWIIVNLFRAPHQRLAYIISTCSLKIVGIHKESRICILKFLDIIHASFTEDI
jgi:hypothetical protein